MAISRQVRPLRMLVWHAAAQRLARARQPVARAVLRPQREGLLLLLAEERSRDLQPRSAMDRMAPPFFVCKIGWLRFQHDPFRGTLLLRPTSEVRQADVR